MCVYVVIGMNQWKRDPWTQRERERETNTRDRNSLTRNPDGFFLGFFSFEGKEPPLEVVYPTKQR
jgi:hypothetical protein